LVFAVSRDKDYEQMLQIALGYFDRIILTQFHRNPRATDPAHLEAVARRVTDPLRPVLIEVEPDPKTAFRRACEGAQRRDEITVAGSLFLLAEIGSWNPSDSGVDC
jgi:folylpolyglutamate synthase/dihydropteroate synthase